MPYDHRVSYIYHGGCSKLSQMFHGKYNKETKILDAFSLRNSTFETTNAMIIFERTERNQFVVSYITELLTLYEAKHKYFSFI